MKKLISLLLSMVFILLIFTSFTIQGNAVNSAFVVPMTGKVQGTGYEHAGVDIHATKGTPVYAVASGKIIYSEFGHTPIYEGYEDVNTRYSVKIKLDEPLEYNGNTYENAFYTHLSELVFEVNQNQPVTSTSAEPYSIEVVAGQLIGYSGLGRGVPHLHFSFEDLYENSDDYEHMGTDDLLKVFGWEYGENIIANEYISSDDYAATTGGMTLSQLKAKFPEGKYWNSMGLSTNNEDGWTNTPCSSHSTTYNCNSFIQWHNNWSAMFWLCAKAWL